MRVLIADDGSAGASEAVALAESIAWPADSTLRVVTVFEPIVMPTAGLGDRGGAVAPELDAAIREHAGESLRAVVERLQAPGRGVEGQTLNGRAASMIVKAAGDFGADLVIVGSRGHGSIASLLLGSVSGEVVDHAPCPVLVARKRTLTRVIFATDESPAAEAAEAILVRWPIFDGVQIHVVSAADVVHPWTIGIAPTMYERVLEAYAADLRAAKVDHERMAADAATRLRIGGRAVDSELRMGDPASEIVATASEQAADLVVLGSRGRIGVTRLLLGSVARNVVSGSSASVLIVRNGAVEPAEPATASN